MKLIFTFLIICFFSISVKAQNQLVSGIVREANTGMAFNGVSIIEKNTNNSVITGKDGRYSITVHSGATIVFSYIGYENMEIICDGRTTYDISLNPTSNNLHEVVVTALGIQRNKNELGYSVQSVGSKDLTEVRQTNLVNALAGRVAGVQVSNGSSGIGSSSRIVIRGENSLTGNNQPLFVIDGVPISNNPITNNTENNEAGFQEVDYGNGAADISPDDIESITVLKGAAAAALYGSRAGSGVIVITTKDGSGKRGNSVTLNSSATFENPLILPQYQNIYGAGSGGLFAYEDGYGAGINDGGLTSFGPKMMGQLITQFNGPSYDQYGNIIRGGDILDRMGNPITPTPFS
ncbi:MAG: TonB-dependent receptor plug domain-containing protein, partial [Chitinophagaceae bacterium]